MQRRTFINLTAYTAAALALPLLDGCTPSKDKVLEQPLLFSHIADAKTIREVGQAYHKLYPNEYDQTKLVEILSEKKPTEDKKQLQTLLDKRVSQDFKTGRTVTVSGWVLSITEARQCALYSIINT